MNGRLYRTFDNLKRSKTRQPDERGSNSDKYLERGKCSCISIYIISFMDNLVILMSEILSLIYFSTPHTFKHFLSHINNLVENGNKQLARDNSYLRFRINDTRSRSTEATKYHNYQVTIQDIMS